MLFICPALPAHSDPVHKEIYIIGQWWTTSRPVLKYSKNIDTPGQVEAFKSKHFICYYYECMENDFSLKQPIFFYTSTTKPEAADQHIAICDILAHAPCELL